MPKEEFSQDQPYPTLVGMHFLGGSAEEWKSIKELLGRKYRWFGLDLPGFGDAAGVIAYSVTEMADYVARALQARRLEQFILVGHSMSGKVAMTAARWAAEGDDRFAGLEGLVLVASSPAGPEPMSDAKREEMLPGLEGGSEKRRSFAESYIRQNTAQELAPEVFEQAVTDVLRTAPAAWRAWLESGSREDWAQRVGVLELPALVIGGEEDSDLGPEALRTHVLPHLTGARLESIAGAGHLLPMEAPEKMARLMGGFVEQLARIRTALAAIEPDYLALIRSDRVSAVTRRVLLERVTADPTSSPAALTPDELRTLQAVSKRVVPQDEGEIDLSVQIDKRLALGTGKGWRYDTLPGDLEAYRSGLLALDREARMHYQTDFAELGDDKKDAVLGSIVNGEFGTESSLAEARPHGEGVKKEGLTGPQMLRWFEDLRAELAGIYVSHPKTLARMGYSGVGDGAESDALTGFVELGIGKVESWEPHAASGGLSRQ